VVLLGTLYPLLLDALGLGKISVGPPYFDTVFVPVLVPLVVLMGIGPLARWRLAEMPDLARRLRWAAGSAVLCALLTGWLHGQIGWQSALGLVMAFWIVASVATNLWEHMRASGATRTSALQRRLRLWPRAMLGMSLAHLGVAVFILGVTMVKSFEVERDVRMDVGDTTEIGGYTFTFEGVRQVNGPNYQAMRGELRVTRGTEEVGRMHPEKRVYLVQRNPMTEAAIDTGLTRDLSVSLGNAVEGRAWTVRAYYKPFVSWIWGGCLLMALGGLVAASDRRYRSARREQLAPPVVAGAIA
jgi:cytochrome c-type biogenesis protein CcmF